MSSRYDHPDAGTGLDSTRWDDVPLDDPADELPDDDPVPHAQRDILDAVSVLLTQVLGAETAARAHGLARFGAELITWGEQLCAAGYRREEEISACVDS